MQWGNWHVITVIMWTAYISGLGRRTGALFAKQQRQRLMLPKKQMIDGGSEVRLALSLAFPVYIASFMFLSQNKSRIAGPNVYKNIF